MANIPTSTEMNNEDDCQLVSFTNKLPYYVRHLCKSTKKNKKSPITSRTRKYFSTRKKNSLKMELNSLMQSILFKLVFMNSQLLFCYTSDCIVK